MASILASDMQNCNADFLVVALRIKRCDVENDDQDTYSTGARGESNCAGYSVHNFIGRTSTL